jgi:hypothetical protein
MLRDTAHVHTRELLALIREAYRLNDELDKAPLGFLKAPEIAHDLRQILSQMWELTRFPERRHAQRVGEQPQIRQNGNLLDDAYCDRIAAELLDDIDI